MPKILVLFLSLALVFGFSGKVFAEENQAAEEIVEASAAADADSSQSGETSSTTEEVTTDDLGIKDPGILPTSRFYFLKNWKRSIQRTFTLDPVKKADLELEISNEQAAEIKKLEEVAPERTDAIARAAENYRVNTERLKARLESLKETSENPNVDKLLEKLADRSIKHQQLFGELKQKFEDKKELRDRFEAMQERVDETIMKIPEKFENPEAFKERMQRVMEKQPERAYKELRDVEILERIGNRLPEDQRAKFEEAKEKIIEKFGERMEKMGEAERKEILRPETLERLPGDNLQKARIMEEVRGTIDNPEVRKKMEEVRKEMIEKGAENDEIKDERVKNTIDDAREYIKKAGEKIAEVPRAQADIRNSAQKLLVEAKAHLAAAEKALSNGNKGEAFGRATSAKVAAQNALRRIISAGEKPQTGDKMMIREGSESQVIR